MVAVLCLSMDYKWLSMALCPDYSSPFAALLMPLSYILVHKTGTGKGEEGGGGGEDDELTQIRETGLFLLCRTISLGIDTQMIQLLGHDSWQNSCDIIWK